MMNPSYTLGIFKISEGRMVTSDLRILKTSKVMVSGGGAFER